MEDTENSSPSFSRARKWGIGFHVTVSVLAAMAIAAMLNYLGHRYNTRVYTSEAAAHKLTPLTTQVLNSLTNKVKVTVFFDRRDPLFSAVSSLVKEYQARSPRIALEFVDYRMPGRAEAIRNQYKLTGAGESSRVIFDYNNQVRTVLASELSDYAVTPQKEIRRTAFRGEQLFTSAILNITQTTPINAYFTQGHGEHDPFSTDDQFGYSRFASLLLNNNVQVKLLPISSTPIPDDCGLLVIASPERPFEDQEIARIDRYLARGGRLLALFSIRNINIETGLERLLSTWDIDVGFNIVQDPAQAQAGESGVVISSTFGAHPIVRPLARSSLKLVAPRSIRHKQRAQTSADAPKVTELLFSSPGATNLVPRGDGRWAVQDVGRTAFMAAAERGGIQGVSDRGAARVVVTGDSLFIANYAFNQAANSDFANLAVNWLCNRDALLNEIGPSPVAEYQLLLTASQMSRLKWLFLALVPGLVLVFGLFVWLRRRA